LAMGGRTAKPIHGGIADFDGDTLNNTIIGGHQEGRQSNQVVGLQMEGRPVGNGSVAGGIDLETNEATRAQRLAELLKRPADARGFDGPSVIRCICCAGTSGFFGPPLRRV